MSHLLPGIEMHARDLAIIWFGHVNIERLALIYEGGSIGSHVDYLFLRDLPHGFVKILNILRDILTSLE